MLKSWFCIYRLNSLQILQIKSYSFLIYPKFCVPTSEMPKWTFLLKYRFGYKKAQKIQNFFDFRKVHNLTFLWIYTLLGVFPASKDLRPFVCSSLVQCWPMSGFFIYIYIYIYIWEGSESIYLWFSGYDRIFNIYWILTVGVTLRTSQCICRHFRMCLKGK